MDGKYIKLTTAEIGVLWSTYIECTATRCFHQHFLQHLQDEEIKTITEESLASVEAVIKGIEEIYSEEDIPIPQGFSDNDVDLAAPPPLYGFICPKLRLSVWTDFYALLQYSSY